MSAARCTSGKRNLPTRLKEHRAAHGRRGDFEKSAIVKHSHIKDHQIDWQAAQLITPIDAWHPRRIREAIEIVKHDTVPQDIGFFISDIWRPILQTEGSSISKVQNPHHPSPPVLVNYWFSSVSTHWARLNELILQHLFMWWFSSSLLKQQHFPESGILLRTIRAYWSKRRVCTPSFFIELITTQLRFHMVSPQLVLLIILTMQSYKFCPYIILMDCVKMVQFHNLGSLAANSEYFGHTRPWKVVLIWFQA